MRRGDIITIAMAGDYGKPRRAVVIQTDQVTISETVLICMISSYLQDLPSIRIDVAATPDSGLERPSQIMVEKIFAVARVKCRNLIGRIDEETQTRLNEALLMMMGLGR